MDKFTGTEKRSWGGVARKLICCASAMGLAAAFLPAAAFGTDGTSTTYALPAANEVIDFEHTGFDNGHEYTYEYVTIGSSATGRVAPMAQTYYETLGLNYINAYRGPDSIFKGDSAAAHENSASNIDTTYTSGSIGSLQTRNSTLAIMGTTNNVAPDEYIWNYCAWANGATVNADSMALDHGNTTTGAVSVTIGGTEYADFPREVYSECNIISSASSTNKYANQTWLRWVKLENQRDNRPKSGEYNPYFTSYAVAPGGGATMVKGLHTLADTIDDIVADSVDANGNYTLQSRYGGNKADGTGAAIDQYEDIVLGTQYYVMSKIADNTAKKAVTAVLVGYDPETGNYACRKYGAADDPDTNKYGGRVANYTSAISTSITDLGLETAQDVTNEAEEDYVAWYTPEQIVANADACFICDAPSSNKISTYLASASDGEAYVVYAPSGVGQSEEDRTGGLVKAREAAVTAGTKAANFCFSYPANMFGNFYAQGVENGMLAVITSAFTYPDLFGSQGLTDMLAYWAKYVWHINDESIQSIVTGTCSGMSLTGIEIGNVSANFETNAEKYFKAGNEYYIANYEEIDKINGGNLKTFNLDGLKERTADMGKGSTKADAAITASDLSKKYGASFNIGASSTGGALSYTSSDEKVVTVDATTGAAKATGVGSATITIQAAETSNYNAATKTITVKVGKASNPVKATGSSKTVKVSKVKKKAQKVTGAVKVSGAQGKVTYKKASGSNKVTVASNGTLTVKKKTAKGTYKVKVKATAAGNGNYSSGSATATVTIKVK